MNNRLKLRAWKVSLSSLQVQILFGVVFTQIGIATVFYHWVEGWAWVDAFYFSVITIATVGYGDFSPQTVLGKLFTVAYILLGIGVFVTATATLASQFLLAARQEVEGYGSDGQNKQSEQNKKPT